MRNKLVNWFLILLIFVLVSNIVRTMVNLVQEDNIIKESKNMLQKVTEDNQNLKRELARVKSQDYIEREARNKLNLGREGEIVLILPSISPVVTPTPTLTDISPNWQKWIKLFL